MSFPKYEAYKDSGVEWLGEVPEHWDVNRLRFIFEIVKRIAGADGFDVLSITQRGVKVKDLESGEGQLSNDYSKYQIVKKGDFAMNHMDLLTGYVDVSPFEGVTSPDYRVFQLFDKGRDYSQYLLRLLQNGYHQKLFFPYGQGAAHLGRWRLPKEEFKNFLFPRPPSDEQIRISCFLDYETARIDALIAEQESLIALLKEKRQAVISHAVTKGCDRAVPMKDSGVEWLGEVPAHWKIGSLGYYSQIDTGATPDRSKPEYWNGDVPWIKTGEVNYQTIFRPEEQISLEGVKNSAVRLAPKGTLLMAMYGQGVTRGRVAILGIDATYNQACAGIQVNDALKVEFLKDYLMAAYSYVRDDGNETSQMNLSSGFIAKIKVTIPPVQEQIDISNFIAGEVKKFSTLIAESSSVSELLQERRSALIAAAVTGKIDVRNWQPPTSTASTPTLEPVHH